MSDTPVVGKIAFSSVANPNAWDIGESKCLVFASPSEAKRAEELFSAMQRDLAAAQAKLAEVEAEREALKEDAELGALLRPLLRVTRNSGCPSSVSMDTFRTDAVRHDFAPGDDAAFIRAALDAARKKP